MGCITRIKQSDKQKTNQNWIMKAHKLNFPYCFEYGRQKCKLANTTPTGLAACNSFGLNLLRFF